MRKVLCICNTYFQLITLAQLKCTSFKELYMAVLVSDHCREKDQVKTVVENLKKENFFECIEYIESKDIDQGNYGCCKILRNCIEAVRGNLFNIKILDEIIFDELIYYNLHLSTVSIFQYLNDKGYNFVCSRYEEGAVLSYDIKAHNGNEFKFLTKKMKVVFLLEKIFRKKSVSNYVKKFYCYYPEYYEGKLEAVKIPLILKRQEKVKKVITAAFQIKKNALEYKEKYIFFGSIGDFEGGHPIGEVELAKRISEIVGKDNLLVKVHPRDATSGFKKAGLKIDNNSSVPWEVIQLNYNFNNHIFLTTSSTSVLSVNMMMEERPKTFFLYPLCDISHNKVIKETVNALEVLFNTIKRDALKNIYLVNDIRDIL